MIWFDRVPKVELHVHLEGSIPLDALWALIQKYGGDHPSLPDRAALVARFQYRDFPHFIETWCWKNGFLRQYEDFTHIAEAVARDFVSQNIRYAEVFYSPSDFRHHGLQVQELTEAIRAGLDRVPEVEIALIADLVRDNPPVRAMRILEQVNEVRERGVIGIGMGGAEHDHPPEPFAPVYARARQMGFHTTAHAGEAAGAESIWGALRALEPERIGHGTRAFEDEALLGELAMRRIPLEMCPLSNVRTNVVPGLDRHPIRRYWERGILVTINTDDPKMFCNSLAREYAGLEQSLGFTRDEIRRLILQGIDASWLSAARKQQLKAEFERDPNWLADGHK